MHFLFQTAFSLLSLLPFVALFYRTAKVDSLALSQEILSLSLRAAELSAILQYGDPQGLKTPNPQYPFLQEPDAAFVVGVDGFCFLTFRGTTNSLPDILQDFEIGFRPACSNNSTGNATCCNVRTGFDAAYNAPFRADAEQALSDCLTTCRNRCRCCSVPGSHQSLRHFLWTAIYPSSR